MKLTILLLCAIPCIAKCQDYKASTPASVSYYHKQIKLLASSPFDDVARFEKLKELHRKIIVLVKSRNNYRATTVFADVSHANYSAFNSALKQSGFPSLAAIVPRGGIGISGKHNHTMFNVYFLTFGLQNKTSYNNQVIKTSFSNLLQFDIGYDFLKAERFSLYPYAGLSLRQSDLSYTKNPSAGAINSWVVNMYPSQNYTYMQSAGIGYQAGLGVDYALFYNHEKTFKTIFFAKAGVNKPFKTDVYKASDMPDYNPGIKQGDWMLTFGFKFATKR